jgi:hypothetical protein
METNAAGQNLTQAVEDGFYSGLLDQRGGYIEQGSIPHIGGRQASVVFRHAHQTSTEQLNRKPFRTGRRLMRALSLCVYPTVPAAAALGLRGKSNPPGQKTRNLYM